MANGQEPSPQPEKTVMTRGSTLRDDKPPRPVEVVAETEGHLEQVFEEGVTSI